MEDWRGLMDTNTQIIISALASFAASSGFWAWFSQRSNVKSATNQLLLGLAHDRIISLGMSYIKRKWITEAEYHDFVKYLYTPYSKFGGNGLAEKIMLDVSKLPFEDPKKKEVKNGTI
jgi:hypothetical protein